MLHLWAAGDAPVEPERLLGAAGAELLWVLSVGVRDLPEETVPQGRRAAPGRRGDAVRRSAGGFVFRSGDSKSISKGFPQLEWTRAGAKRQLVFC